MSQNIYTNGNLKKISGNYSNVDAGLSTSSTNPVQNQAVATAINEINADLTKLTNKINIKDTLHDNVLDAVKNCPSGITFYYNSNNPTNQPPECVWGSYIILKNDGWATILYADSYHFAFTYAVIDTATSISWTVL